MSFFCKLNTPDQGRNASPPATIPVHLLDHQWQEGGILFKLNDSTSGQGRQSLAYLQQLEEENFVSRLPDGWWLEWETLFDLLEREEHQSSLHLLDLPEVLPLRPQLISHGGLSDSDFRILIQGWRLPDGSTLSSSPTRFGARFRYQEHDYLLPRQTWQLCCAMREFSGAQKEHPGVMTNQTGWACIRRLANTCDAGMDGFLRQTIVLHPDKLNIQLHKHVIGDTPVLEVIPGFEGQPANWLRGFDALTEVQDSYRIPGEDGSITHILIPPDTRSVLDAIRRLPGRRVAGDDALMLIRNPHAVLGDVAVNVIDPEAYQDNLIEAGIHFYRFHLAPELTERGQILHIDLLLEPDAEGAETVILRLQEPEKLSMFVDELEVKLARGLPCGFWQGYELCLADVQKDELQGIRELLAHWQQEQLGEWLSNLFDPSEYGDRVLGIGIKECVTSKYLVKEKGENWLPEDVLMTSGLDAELLNRWDTSSRNDYNDFVGRIREAEQSRAPSVRLPKLEIELKLPVARRLAEVWGEKFHQSEAEGRPDENKPREGLLISHNLDEAPEAAAPYAPFASQEAVLPSNLREGIKLHPHQLEGVAWLQSLFKHSPHPVSGGLLADDMGLGKTLQLLTFISEYLEQGARNGPVLIVAPVSLLDNWQREFETFFHTAAMPVLRLSGPTLAAVKLDQHDIPTELQQHGIRNLLRPNWHTEASIVLTTYETLRDQELSLARVEWGIMVCDEAQKIKNPAALVTQSAKAVHARFRIACTGTPVENSLTDLWCLFDFIQPGKLGALNTFGRQYKQPIESGEDQGNLKLEALRQLIAPQILRRLKQDVATLPPKIEHEDSRHLTISPIQDKLYRSELLAFQDKNALLEKAGDRNIAILGLLHTLRMLCAHPHAIRPEGDLMEASPKMYWLMTQLESIRLAGEKAIIFTEFRELQREIKLAIQDRFALSEIMIINGDTKSSSTRGDSRQGLIDRFQQQEGFGIIILSTTAVGFGVNVQAANHVFHFTRPWNPAKEDQATDRAYRIGQKKTVHVYYPTITSKDYQTFETKLDELLTRKRELSRDMLQSGGDVSIDELMTLSG